MNTFYSGWVGAAVLVAGLTSIPVRHHETPHSAFACRDDPNYQRLAFWVGDWDVVDSTGKHYANQHVHEVIDDCAITADWVGTSGDRGMNVSAYDVRTGDWKQVYISNQVPSRSGVQLRKSDPSYDGPGIRFIAILDPPAGNLARSRVTIMPMGGHRVMQLFENSSDGGKTWYTQFKAEHRPE